MSAAELVYTLSAPGDSADWKPAAGGGGLGVWHDWFDHGNAVQPIRGVTLGNGTLVAKWWSPAEVEIAFDTQPFLAHVYIVLKFGSTTTADDNLVVATPNFQDQGLELDPFLLQGSAGTPDPFNVCWGTQVIAYSPTVLSGRLINGVAISGVDSAGIITVGEDALTGPAWSGISDTPFVWGEGAVISVWRSYYAAFYGN